MANIISSHGTHSTFNYLLIDFVSKTNQKFLRHRWNIKIKENVLYSIKCIVRKMYPESRYKRSIIGGTASLEDRMKIRWNKKKMWTNHKWKSNIENKRTDANGHLMQICRYINIYLYKHNIRRRIVRLRGHSIARIIIKYSVFAYDINLCS